jgi:phospholipid/cholesterol/gamma-HCH transport system substrate-binding protein
MKRYGDLQIGITVLLALAVLVFGVLWFKGFSASRETYPLTVYFPQASGLDKGDPVEVAGVVQGKVSDLEYERGRAKLVLDINHHAELYRDATVAIANYGMMGQKFVAIDPGHPDTGPLDISKPLDGEFQPGVGDMMTEVGQSLKATNLLVDRLNRFLAVIDSTGGAHSISRTLENVEAMSGDVSSLAAENRKSLGKAIENFEAASGELRGLLEERGPALRATLANLETTTARADTLSANLASATADLREILERLKSDESSVGALLEDRALYDRLLATVGRTDSLLIDFQRNPRKYLKFSVF